MVRCSQQILSGYVALCLALAGFVGTSPTLHRLIEHGGRGVAHVHFHGTDGMIVLGHRHDQPAVDTQERRAAATQSVSRTLFVHSHQPAAVPAIQLDRLWHALGHLLAPEGEDPAPDTSEDPAHHHDSLAQTLAGGLIEQSLDSPQLIGLPLATLFDLRPFAPPSLDVRWDSQTASRGPPPRRS